MRIAGCRCRPRCSTARLTRTRGRFPLTHSSTWRRYQPSRAPSDGCVEGMFDIIECPAFQRITASRDQNRGETHVREDSSAPDAGRAGLGSIMRPTPQGNQLMSKHRVLSFKSAF